MIQAPDERPERLLGDLAANYREHLHDYERWLSLASRAKQKLEEDELDEFLELHQQKQVVAERLRKQEQQLRAERDELGARLNLRQFTLSELESATSLFSADGAFAKAVADWREVLSELNTAMEQVAKTERQTEQALRERLRSLGDAMSDARSTRQAVRAYNRPEVDAYDAQFIDRRG